MLAQGYGPMIQQSNQRWSARRETQGQRIFPSLDLFSLQVKQGILQANSTPCVGSPSRCRRRLPPSLGTDHPPWASTVRPDPTVNVDSRIICSTNRPTTVAPKCPRNVRAHTTAELPPPWARFVTFFCRFLLESEHERFDLLLI